MAGLGAIATIASLAGTAVSAIGTIAAGRAEKQAADYRAAQLEVNAKAERAEAQNDALDVARKKRLDLSRIQARASASGFGAADASVLDHMGEVAKYGTLNQQLARYGGEARAAELNSSAEATRMQGRAAAQQAGFRAAGTIIGGVGNFARKYG